MKLSALMAAVILAVAPAAHAEPAASQTVPKPYSFVRSVQFDMTSKINGRTYRIFVHTPPTPPPPGGYPVLYVTDGNGTFPVAAGQAELEALAGGHMMVVGVGYPTDDVLLLQVLRNRDLTPSPPTKFVPGISTKPDDYGGADFFYRFITEELRPAIAAATRSIRRIRPSTATRWAACSPWACCSTTLTPSAASSRAALRSGGMTARS